MAEQEKVELAKVVGLEIDSSGVELKGIAGEVRIHRLRRALDEG